MFQKSDYEDGVITRAEMIEVSRGVNTNSTDTNFIEKFFEEPDTNEDGKLSWKEFLDIRIKYKDKELRDMFDFYDGDCTGYIR